MFYKIQHNHYGNIMLLSVLISTGLLAVGVSLGTLALQRSKQTVYSVDSMAAYYQAETAGEDAVYQIRKLGVQPAALNVTANNWTRSVVAHTNAGIKLDLRQGESTDIDLHGSDGSWASNVKSLVFSWKDFCHCTIFTIQVFPLKTDGSIDALQQSNTVISSATAQNLGNGVFSQEFDNIALQQDQALRIKITVNAADGGKESYIDNLTLVAKNSANAVISPSTAIHINSSGSVGSVDQGVGLILE